MDPVTGTRHDDSGNGGGDHGLDGGLLGQHGGEPGTPGDRATIDDAPEAARPALKAVSQQLGFTPNSFKLMSLSPATLSGVLAFQSALGKTVDVRTRDVVALAVSQVNGCNYALAVQFLLTNFMNKVAETDIDFPGAGYNP